jgi:tRNA (adenine57-N1/adenine58-N1)-methyltransferase catalytic subunit
MCSLAWNLHGTHAQIGDLAQLAGVNHKNFIIQLEAGKIFHTHRGKVAHDDLIGQPWGSQVFSHTGSPFFLLQPPLSEMLRGIKRNTQILYPKDIGFILVMMGIGPGQQIVEAGTGSGALSTAFAYAIGPQGHLTTYEARPEMMNMAMNNLERVGLSDRVTFNLRDIRDGFDVTNADALFLDLPNPSDYIDQVRSALKPGGFFGCILPTVNQVSLILSALQHNRFAFIDVCEVLLRFYKPEPDRLRPVDRMIAHTGFLIFARPVLLKDETQAEAIISDFSEGLVETVDDVSEDLKE